MSALNKLDMFENQITHHAIAPQVVIGAGMGNGDPKVVYKHINFNSTVIGAGGRVRNVKI